MEFVSGTQNGGVIEELMQVTAERAEQHKRLSGSRRVHGERMNQILTGDPTFRLNRAHLLAVTIHDMITKGSRTSEQLDMDFIGDYVEILSSPGASYTDQTEGLYALGLALAKHRLEHRLEEWRARFTLDRSDADPLSAEEDEFLNSVIAGSLQTRGIPDSPEMVGSVRAQISQALFDGGAAVTPEMRAFRLPLDLLHLIETMQETDLDAIRLYGAEQLDNLNFPNPDRPASTWRDSMESLWLAAMLQIITDDRLASALRSASYRYLNADSPFMQRAVIIHNDGEEYVARNTARIEDIMQDAYTETCILHGVVPGIAEQSHRVKKIGSILEKLSRNRADAQEGTVADGIGYLAKVPDLPPHINKPLFMFEMGVQLAKDLQKANLNLRIGHTREQDHTVEINYGSPEEVHRAIEQIQKRHDFLEMEQDGDIYTVKIHISKRNSPDGQTGRAFHVVLGPARKPRFADNGQPGYQGVHVSAVYERPHSAHDGGTSRNGAEFRIVEETAKENNDIGYAADFLYRAENAMGLLGELVRAEEYTLASNLVTEQLAKIKRIHTRSALLRTGTHLWLHPITLNQLIVLGNQLPKLQTLVARHYNDLYPADYQDILRDLL
ncbi:MAG: hypothetical protein TR69_WS6001000559 [candidate division WS6 bacterium OLB20]|uniref:Uncharacterized protein n=1 Tax=candidate division WS6 bacterium OLB20 TaxID=1617426 RepID=A0A136LY28_9BACT|nr:MAG: hypothetical protein TR69_WS6001000559 [candidate division WS6 bacterium OLB20]